MQNKETFIGIDVSKNWLDAALYGTKHHLRITNNAQGFKQLQTWLKSLAIPLQDAWFVFEYTGGYEYRLVQFCASKAIRFTRVPGLEIKKSLGMQRGKNDKIDACRIATYGHEKKEKLTAHTQGCTTIQKLKQLLTQRNGFVQDKKANEHRMEELRSMMEVKKTDPVMRHYQQAVVFSEKMVQKTEKEIKKLIEEKEALHRNYQLLLSVPGIGSVNAWMTLAYTENFERFSCGRKYGAYAGVVPYEHTSGKSIKGKSRLSHMANKEIKATLDMAARAAMSHDPELKGYAERRKAMGKHYNSIKNEIKFKLILRMFAVVKKQTTYVDNLKKAA